MANVWSMAKPTRKCILAGDIIYAFDRKVSSRTFDSLGRTFDSSGECLASLRSAKQLSPSESKVRPWESKVLLSTFPSQSKWCHPLGTIIPFYSTRSGATSSEQALTFWWWDWSWSVVTNYLNNFDNGLFSISFCCVKDPRKDFPL